MEHLEQILWLLSWPLMIFISYRAIVYFLKKFEQNRPREDNK